MGKQSRLALGTLLGALAVASLAYSQYPALEKEETLNQRLARLAKMPEPQAARLMSVLGPAVREELAKGKQVSLPGLGTFRIVRVAEHRDLRNGRPVVIPAVNTVEFLPEGGTLEAANGENVQPAETVPAFQYIALPNQTPSVLTPKVRSPSLRTP